MEVMDEFLCGHRSVNVMVGGVSRIPFESYCMNM